MMLKLKQGSGIHIKKANKGKFTSYCGGLVTEECIRKGKNSSDPKIRKRATFAANARKWKHLNGGNINSYQVGGLLLELLPIYGTYKDYQRFADNPSWKTGASLGLSALGDIAMLSGVGAVVKGASVLNKANKVRKAAYAADIASNAARTKYWKAAKALKREKNAAQSLALMNAPTAVLLDRTRKLNKAREVANQALKNDDIALQNTIGLFKKSSLLERTAQPWINNGKTLTYSGAVYHAPATAIERHKQGGKLRYYIDNCWYIK